MEHWKNLSLENLTEEIEGIVYTEEWRPITGYEGLYEVSSFGRILSVQKISKHPRGGFMKRRARILKQSYDKDKYLQVLLCKDGVAKGGRMHRLVAIAFIPNPLNKPIPNHLKGIKWDNRVHQLEWATDSENAIHSYKTGLQVSTLKGKTGKECRFSKKVNQYTVTGDLVNTHDGVREAQRQTGIHRCSIMQVCNKNPKYKTAGGYKWEYA